MWAQLLTRPGRFEQVEVPSPDPDGLRPGQTLLRVLGGAVCGSDLPYFAGRVCPLFDDGALLAANRPGFPLHEVVGEVVATADPELTAGDAAVGWATGTDALAEYVVTSDDSLVPVPHGFSVSEALTLQPLACVLGTVERLDLTPGDQVAVLGLGPFGLLFCHVLHELGASVTGVDRVDRSDVAAAFQVDVPVHSSTDRWAAKLRDDERPTVVVDAIGHQSATITDAIRAASPGGQVFGFGVPDDTVYPVPFHEIFRKGLSLAAGVVSDRRRYLQLAGDYLQRHRQLNNRFVTDVLSFHRAQEAFELAARPAPGRLKVQFVAG